VKRMKSLVLNGLIVEWWADAPSVQAHLDSLVVREIMSDDRDEWEMALYNADSRRRRHLDYICDDKMWEARARRVSKPKLVK